MNKYNVKAIVIIAFIAILQAVLFGLKAINVISWSWLWVLTPLWVPYITLLIIGAALIIYMLIFNLTRKENKDE